MKKEDAKEVEVEKKSPVPSIKNSRKK